MKLINILKQFLLIIDCPLLLNSFIDFLFGVINFFKVFFLY